MRKILLSVAGSIALASCAPGALQSPVDRLQESAMYEVRSYAMSVEGFLETGHSEAEAVEMVKNMVQGSLKDPDSAKFRNLGIGTIDGMRVVCGEVNGKNSYGGYVGYRKFTGSLSANTLESSGGRYPAIDGASNAGIYAACGSVRQASTKAKAP